MIISLYSTESRVEVVESVENNRNKGKKESQLSSKLIKSWFKNKPNKTTSFEKEGNRNKQKMKFMKVIFLFTFVIVAINASIPIKKSATDKNEVEENDQDMYDEIADKVIESK